jgi:hypothetical protein
MYTLVTNADRKNLYHYRNNTFEKIASLHIASDIKVTPNPCMYKVYEIETLKMVTTETTPPQVMPADVVYIEIVDELPEVGESFLDLAAAMQGEQKLYVYYSKVDNRAHLYYTQELLDENNLTGVTPGWDRGEGNLEVPIIYSLDEATEVVDTYGLATKKPHLYFYDGEDWIEMATGFRAVHNSKKETITFVES